MSHGTFCKEHEELNSRLDNLIASIHSDGYVACFRAAHDAAARHYLREDEYFHRQLKELPGPAAKMLAQHAEVLEIAAQVEHSLAEGQTTDAIALIRRFHAMASHNLIEEERDVFPLFDERG